MLLNILAIAAISPLGAQESPSVMLLRDFLIAVNSKDKRVLETFCKDRATAGPPVADRVARLYNLADQGAPFKIEGTPKEQGNTITALIVDREGIKLNLTMTVAGNPPKMESVLFRMSQAVDPALLNWKDLGSLAETLVKNRPVPGAGVGFRHAGVSEVAVAGVREKGKDAKLLKSDPLKIGSIGKPICSTLIAILIEKGKLRWDQTLKESFPEIPMKPGYEHATLEQVMKHRGGIPADGTFTRARLNEILGEEKTAQGMRKRYAKDILGRDPVAKPGDQFQYSNAGYSLLGHLAERVMGKPYEQLVQEFVFDPLGLKGSFAGVVPPKPEWPVGHLATPQGLQAHTLDGPLASMLTPAGGGMWMTIEDLTRFGEEHSKGLQGKDGLLKAETVKRLHAGEKEGPGGMMYACGWGIQEFPEQSQSHGHNGSDGTMRAELLIFPRSGLVAAAIVTSGGEMAMTPSLEAALAIARRFDKP